MNFQDRLLSYLSEIQIAEQLCSMGYLIAFNNYKGSCSVENKESPK